MIQEKKKGAQPVRHTEKKRERPVLENASKKRPTVQKKKKGESVSLEMKTEKATPQKRKFQNSRVQPKKVKPVAPQSVVEEKKPTLPSTFKKKGAGIGELVLGKSTLNNTKRELRSINRNVDL